MAPTVDSIRGQEIAADNNNALPQVATVRRVGHSAFRGVQGAVVSVPESLGKEKSSLQFPHSLSGRFIEFGFPQTLSNIRGWTRCNACFGAAAIMVPPCIQFPERTKR